MHRNTHVSSRSTFGGPKNSRSTSVGSTVLVNLDVYIVRATIGRDISPDDDDLIVLFRRNSKEVTSEPTRWHDDHIAEWNQHVGIQTSLLRNKAAVDPTDYLCKDYEIVLVALPSHSAVALFTIDFAQIVQSQRANRPKPFRVSPTKCRDLAATLEFEVVWEYASAPPPLTPVTPTSSSVATTSSSSLSMAGRRTNVSVVSMSSQNSELPLDGSCGDCRSLRRRLERKENQILQLENFLKESQKRIDSLVFENEELVVREQAETKNAGQYRALNMRLLQELEMAFQFCAQQMLQVSQQAAATGIPAQPQLFMFLPQFEFMERVKQFHAELERIYSGSPTEESLLDTPTGEKPLPASPAEAWKTFNLRQEMEAALERNQRLQHQLEFLSNSLSYEGQVEFASEGISGFLAPLEMRRKATDASSASDFSITDLNSHAQNDPLMMSRVAPVRTVTEQLNALERENFLLKAKLESAMNDMKSGQSGRGGSSPSESAETTTSGSSMSRNSLITASLSLLPVVPDESPLRLEVDQLQSDKIALAQQLADLKAELDRVRNEQQQQQQLQLQQRESMTPPAVLPIGVVPGSPVHRKAGGMSSSQVSSGSGSGSGASPGGSDFLNKIYMDVGKAKVALEEKVKRLNQELGAAHDENNRLQEQLKLSMEKAVQEKLQAGDDVVSDSGDEAPTTVEILSDEEDAHHAKNPITTSATDSSSDGEYALRAELESQVQHLQQVIEEKSSQLKVQEQELQFMKQHLQEKATAAADMEIAKMEIEKELGTTKLALTRAEKKITALEIKIETLEMDHKQQQSETEEKRAIAPKSNSNRDDDVSDLAKQLKNARQEVMQLRYRSNNLESVHEKLEEALKEKKTIQVKLTALEGQLYEQRSRTISGNNFSSEGVKDSAMIEELHRQLDQKSAQLMIAQRDAESLRRELMSGPQTTAAAASASAAAVAAAVAAASTQSSVDISELEAKVAKFSLDIDRLSERNEDQALRINALSERVEKTMREKYELEGIMKEMLKEMDELAASPPQTPARGKSREVSSASEASQEIEVMEEVEEFEELEEKAPASIPLRSSGNKVVDRYASALKTTFERRGSAPRPPAPAPSPPRTPVSSKVAHLIKNFSSEESNAEGENAAKRNGKLSSSIKKFTKIDFRQRQGSGAST